MNPLMMMIQMAQRGRNPLGALQQMGAGPQLQQMQQMLAGKNYNQLLQSRWHSSWGCLSVGKHIHSVCGS